MILKLLKYDLKGIGRKLLPLYALTIVLSLLNRFSANRLFSYESQVSSEPWFEMLSAILVGIYIIAIIAVFIVTFYILVAKYNRSVFGDEGYLTNTLPLTQTQIIMSKTINFLIWSLISTLVAGISLIIIVYQSWWMPEFMQFMREVGVLIKQLWTSSLSNNKIAIILFAITIIITPISEILNIFLCVGIGNKFKHKLAAGVVAYLVINMFISFITTLVTNNIVDSMSITQSFNSAFYMGTPNFYPMSIVTFLLTVGQIAAFFFGTKYIQEKQLNLE